MNIDVDALAQVIRQVNGDNRMGAGALAEKICEWIAAAPVPPQGEAQPVAWAQAANLEAKDPQGFGRFPTKLVKDLANGYTVGLYTRSDAGEVETERKFRESAEGGWREANRVIAMQRQRLDALEQERDTLRAKLSERDAILSELRDDPRIWIRTPSALCSRINDALSTASPATINKQGEGE